MSANSKFMLVTRVKMKTKSNKILLFDNVDNKLYY